MFRRFLGKHKTSTTAKLMKSGISGEPSVNKIQQDQPTAKTSEKSSMELLLERVAGIYKDPHKKMILQQLANASLNTEQLAFYEHYLKFKEKQTREWFNFIYKKYELGDSEKITINVPNDDYIKNFKKIYEDYSAGNEAMMLIKLEKVAGHILHTLLRHVSVEYEKQVTVLEKFRKMISHYEEKNKNNPSEVYGLILKAAKSAEDAFLLPISGPKKMAMVADFEKQIVEYEKQAAVLEKNRNIISYYEEKNKINPSEKNECILQAARAAEDALKLPYTVSEKIEVAVRGLEIFEKSPEYKKLTQFEYEQNTFSKILNDIKQSSNTETETETKEERSVYRPGY